MISNTDAPPVHPTPPRTLGPAAEVLAAEIATYRRVLPDLLQAGQAGRFVLLKGDQVIGLWDTQAEALAEACSRFGLEPFAVKRIEPQDAERF